MNRATTRRTLMMGIFLAALVFLLAAATAYSQEEVTTVQDSGFTHHLRPHVPFDHDAHNEKADIYACNACHHVYEDGVLLEYESSEDMECSECHLADAQADEMSLMRIYHLNCKGCHQQEKAGPVMCGECHRR